MGNCTELEFFHLSSTDEYLIYVCLLQSLAQHNYTFFRLLVWPNSHTIIIPIRCQEACKKPYKALYVYVGQRSLSHYKYIMKHTLKYDVKLDEDKKKYLFFISQDVGYLG